MQDKQLSILFRGQTIELPLVQHQKVWDVKLSLIEALSKDDGKDLHLTFTPSDIKLLWKGRVVPNDTVLDELLETTTLKSKKSKVVYSFVATGVSTAEASRLQQENESMQRRNARLVKDDLSAAGKQRLQQRAVAGQRRMRQQQQKQRGVSSSYCFGAIETLPGLPNEHEARRILEMLSQDPGILACMAKHQWNVGTLAELYPEGNVGESPVCVMGLNQNHGAKILLRLRTDDLSGFRKILSIRKVLYHELAHNVHSEHDSNFFQLMRQIERECTALDWTQGAGVTGNDNDNGALYTAGTYVLGGSSSVIHCHPRELAAAAAELRMTAEEVEIEQNCGCSSRRQDLFLPAAQPPHNGTSTKTSCDDDLICQNDNDKEDESSMDIS